MKKIFKVSNALMGAFLCFLGASCSSNSNSLSVTNFQADSTSYSEGDAIEFTLTLNNPNNYKISAAVINDKSYTITQSALSTKVFKVSDKDLTFSHSNYTYTLSKIVYSVDGEVKELTVKNRSLVLTEKAVKTEDIVVKNMTMKSLTNPDMKTFYQSDEIETTIELERKDNVRILYFYFTITDENDTTKTIKKAYNDDGKSKVYTISFTMPAMSGKTTVDLSDVDYVLGTNKKDKALNYKTSCDVMIQPLTLLNATVSKTNGFSTDVNDYEYFDASSQVNLKIELSNPSNLPIQGIVICGQTFKLETSEIAQNTQTKKVTINKKINLSAIKTTPTKLSIDKIIFKDENNTELGMKAELTQDIYYYDKIISNAEDLKSMKVQNGVITGNYILARDITVSSNGEYNLFNDLIFAGKLEGNGHSIICTGTTKPMFASIANVGVIQNTTLNISATSTEILCATNEGKVKNIKLSGKESVSTKGETAILCYKNKGIVSDIEFLTALDGNYGIFSFIADNDGDISNVIVNPQNIKLGKNSLSVMPANNTGTVSNIILRLTKWFNNVTAYDYDSQNLLVLPINDGSYSNIILNNDWLQKISEFNTKIDGPQNSGAGFFIGIIEQGKDLYNSLVSDKKYFSIENYVLSEKYKDVDVTEYRATIVNNVGFDASYYTTLGFAAYNTSNNSFWHYSGNEVTLNWSIKK